MKNSGLENAIQDFMEHSLAQMSNIDKKLELMKKFQEVLTREALQVMIHMLPPLYDTQLMCWCVGCV
jgi:hypothetical protein